MVSKTKPGDKKYRWTFLYPVLDESGKTKCWMCRCDCGTEAIKDAAAINAGRSRSCGCLKRELQSGTNNPMHRPEVAEKVRQRMLSSERQKENLAKAVAAANTEEVKIRRKATNQQRYGGNSPASSRDVVDKAAATNIERRGVKAPIQDPTVKAKMVSTNLQRYGVDNATKNKEIAKRARDALSVSLRKKSDMRFSDGRSLVEVCEEHNILPTSARNLIYGGMDIEDVMVWIENHKQHISSLETSLLSSLHEAGIPAERLDKKTEHGYRVDIVVEGRRRVYVEADGLYYHSDAIKEDKRYHFEKREAFEKANDRILQFRQDEILNDGNKVASLVASVSGANSRKVYARKLDIRPISFSEASAFFEKTHLMGAGTTAKAIGGFIDGELVVCLSYRKYKDGIDIARFSSALFTTVCGGLSRLISYVEKLEKPRFIQSFVDLRYGDGHSLETLGFKRVSTTLGWEWTNNKATFNRLKCRANMDDRKLSEAECAKELGWHRIYDAGQAKYVRYLK